MFSSFPHWLFFATRGETKQRELKRRRPETEGLKHNVLVCRCDSVNSPSAHTFPNNLGIGTNPPYQVHDGNVCAYLFTGVAVLLILR